MPHARTLDPSTSHQAAASILDTRTTMRVILQILAKGSATDEVIGYVYDGLVDADRAPMASPSGLRSRRAELVDLELVEDSGERRPLSTGRRAIVWQITDLGRSHVR
jgi:hypothetical protein